MTIAERVNDYITRYQPKAFCDDCLHAELGLSLRQQAHRVTSALGTTNDFRREKDTCSLCGALKMVTRRV